MTVASDISRWAYNGDGSTDTFAYTTKIFAKTDLLVYVDGTLKTVDTHYTVSGVGDAGGGNVVFTAGNEPASGTNNVIIIKAIPSTQGASLPLGGKFPSTTVENALDRLTMLVQQVNKKVVRSLRQPDEDATDIDTLPAKATRAGLNLGFDDDGDPVARASSGELDIPVPVADGGTGASTASAARTNLGLAIGTDVQAFDADTLKADTADVLTAGFAGTPYNAGTKSSGTFTPDEANGNLQYAVNGGAHTLAPPTNNCSIVIQYTNNGSAGAITTSGFTKVTGSTLTTTNGDDFMFYVTKLNGFSHLHVQALQ